ncbi:hypothetical protein [Pedobacter mendelii]|uniref:Uncharacterized protein n=1 Tax=Pedobacter mendelii TaxID=1908240 RepID=A0ABQ2BIF1_9SPHI|nr:hypothetical protein [Pedobacter mendelii]GGI25272.1 hypothetical protein GCM10008119_16830 [Pedobacter mendelii]
MRNKALKRKVANNFVVGYLDTDRVFTVFTIQRPVKTRYIQIALTNITHQNQDGKQTFVKIINSLQLNFD